MSKTSNDILIDRAKNLNNSMIKQIEKFIKRASDNDTKRTTITYSTLNNLVTGMDLIGENLDQIKF